MNAHDLSVVIPVFNEEDNLEPLHEKLAGVLNALGLRYEIIFVDDGSTDRSRDILRSLHEQDQAVKAVFLRRNFGQHPATFAGFAHAGGEIIITLDADLQNDPADIPKLLKKLEEGYDVVCGWRQDRVDPLLTRKIPSLVVNRMISRSSNLKIHDYGCFLRAYRNWAAKEIVEYGVVGGWFPVLFGTLGFNVGEAVVSHHERAGKGGSKHDIFKRMEQFMSVFMGVATKPFQAVEILGVLLVLGGLALEFLLAVLWLFFDLSIHMLFPLLGLFFMLWGFSIGVVSLIGEYIVRMNYEISKKPIYLVREILD